MSIIKFRKIPELFPNRKVRIVRIRNNYGDSRYFNKRNQMHKYGVVYLNSSNDLHVAKDRLCAECY